MDYIYDGTFEGLLTCVHHHYYTEKADGIFIGEAYQPSMLNGYMEVETDEVKATTVYEAVEKKISTFDLRRIYRAFLSSDPDKEMKILRYLVLGFRKGSVVSMLHGYPAVYDIEAIEKKISREKDRFCICHKNDEQQALSHHGQALSVHIARRLPSQKT